MRATRVIALAVATGLVLSACGTSGDSGESKTDGTITLSMGTDPGHTLPPDGTESVSSTLINMVYDGLFDYDTSGKLVPVIAEAVPTSTDNIHWTIKIKSGLKFQNGEAVDAESFVRAWNYGAYGPNAMGGNSFYSRIKGAADMVSEDPDGPDGPKTAPEPKAKELTGLKATDATTIDIELEKAFSGFPTMLGYLVFFPMAKACLDAVDACKEKPIGNGPFQLKTWDKGVALTIERWEDYAGTKPAYKTLTWKIFPDGAPTFPDFEAGQLDMEAVPEENYQSAKGTYGDRMLEVPTPSLSYIGFPLYDDFYKQKEVRQALSLAVDRDLLNEALYQGRYTPATSFSPPGIIPGAIADTCGYCKLDVDKAKELLAKLPGGGWPEGKKLKLWINTAASGANEKWVKAFGDQVKQNLGIDYEYELVEWNAYLAKTQAHEVDGPYRLGWSPDYALIENYLTPVWGGGAANNRSGYENPEFTAALEAGDTAPTLDEAILKYQEAEKILGEDMPGIPMFYSTTATVVGERLDLDSVVINPVLGGADLRLLKLK
ncbi:peptide ABC transporter substrate-binding protein [Phytomonospora endophytica]|uniref:Peptide/nickel transport system substrate-binding protein n=1 Tax=Phytomonospora endophytica TaxID=714109 RepID=A0A841FS46_9ACTN|nr:ABC transporter substrate-binding protein [Phytomonospora endophytica]MBB6034790.1 peptide/nickel transport system substrate-binding protein [Phytomonospora endophytica]GIG69007.1 putative peptide ABC transporter DppA [Phytomonospora endophytica]